MSDTLIETDFDWMNCPLGADLDPAVHSSVVESMVASGAELSVLSLTGTWRRLVASGVKYQNLRDHEADFVRLQGSNLVKSTGRKITRSGILEPFGQQTGICNGCGWSAMAWVAWCARYMTTGTGLVPREVAFLYPYIVARGGLRGDSGAYPSHTARAFHDIGVLPIDGGGRWNLASLPPHGPNSQESLAIQMRDNPRVIEDWVRAANGLQCRVMSPRTESDVADCLAARYPVGNGMSRQIAPTRPGSTGVSALNPIRGGHWTFFSGWFLLNNRLVLIKDESWWNIRFPGSAYPDQRVVVQTDDGPRTLYEGQGAVLASDVMAARPELWACGYPGSR